MVSALGGPTLEGHTGSMRKSALARLGCQCPAQQCSSQAQHHSKEKHQHRVEETRTEEVAHHKAPIICRAATGKICLHFLTDKLSTHTARAEQIVSSELTKKPEW